MVFSQHVRRGGFGTVRRQCLWFWWAAQWFSLALTAGLSGQRATVRRTNNKWCTGTVNLQGSDTTVPIGSSTCTLLVRGVTTDHCSFSKRWIFLPQRSRREISLWSSQTSSLWIRGYTPVISTITTAVCMRDASSSLLWHLQSLRSLRNPQMNLSIFPMKTQVRETPTVTVKYIKNCNTLV